MFVQADFTVFSQATPFQHSPHFLDLLGNPQLYQPVQCMTEVYASEGDPAHVTPKEVVQIYRQVPLERDPRILGSIQLGTV